MPCWYYEKKDLRNTPSLKDAIAAEVETRYRREGARFIIDSGTKLGLRYDTCATGVVYFHRFYMFHSFRHFHRFVTAACCLFLAGKVEETPKKCKDIMKITRSMLTESQFAVFGEDPREELMTLERILLQTIKFDLMVEHPYAMVLRFAKQLKGDKDKLEKLVQMSWTFVNDSLCTNLCLQWEPDIIAVSLMYLGSRLKKVELNDWQGKAVGSKAKWYDSLVPDVTLDIMEEVCHQVLDLYSKSKQTSREDSPPPPPPPPKPSANATATKRSRSPSPTKAKKTSRQGSPAKAPVPSPAKTDKSRSQSSAPAKKAGGVASTYSNTSNPYMSSQMYSSSFMSGEGSNAIQTLIGGQSRAPAPAYPSGQYAQGSQNPTSGHQVGEGSGYSNNTYAAPTTTAYTTSSNPAFTSQQFPTSGSSSSYEQQQQQQYPNQYNQYNPPYQQYSSQYQSSSSTNQYPSNTQQYPSNNQPAAQYSNAQGQGYNYNDRGGASSQSSGSNTYSQQGSAGYPQSGAGSYSQQAGAGSYSQQPQGQGSYPQQGYNHGGSGSYRGGGGSSRPQGSSNAGNRMGGRHRRA